MGERNFWLSAPIYIVICVLLGFVIAILGAQNVILKNQLDTTQAQLEQVKQAQEESKKRGDRIEENTDRVINYLRCISLTPVGERTAELVDKCLEQDLPAQDRQGSGPTSFLSPAPGTGRSSQPGSNSSPSSGSSGNTPPTGSDTGTVNPQPDNTGGLLTPVINPLCNNLTPRICGTLGL